MALTGKKTTSRLDFSSMVDDAVSPIDNTEARISDETAAADTEKPQKEAKREESTSEDTAAVEKKRTPREPKPRKEETSVSEVEKQLESIAKSVRGKQRSIYLEGDVDQYIENISKKTGAKYSSVLNLLIRSIMNQNK